MSQKIYTFWLNFIADLEAGKRIIVVFVIAVFFMARAIMNQNNEIRALNNKLTHQQEISNAREAQLRDSASAMILRVIQKSNDEVTTFLKGELGKYEELKKANERIIKQSQK